MKFDSTTEGVFQFTPHGSGCSVQFGTNLTSAAPGSGKGCLIFSDLEAARDAMVGAGIGVGEIFHLGRTARSVARILSIAPSARSPCLAIPTATAGWCGITAT